MNKNNKNYQVLLRDVVAQGPSKSRRKKNVNGLLFPRAMLMPRVSEDRGFP